MLSRFEQLLSQAWTHNGDAISRMYTGTKAMEGRTKVGGAKGGGAMEGGTEGGGAMEGRTKVGGAKGGGAMEGRPRWVGLKGVGPWRADQGGWG